jgi:hypothetical protein
MHRKNISFHKDGSQRYDLDISIQLLDNTLSYSNTNLIQKISNKKKCWISILKGID